MSTGDPTPTLPLAGDLWQQVIDSSENLVAVVDPALRLRSCNQAYQKAFPGSGPGSPVPALQRELLERALAGSEISFTSALDGVRPYLQRYVPLRTPSGQVSGAVCYLRPCNDSSLLQLVLEGTGSGAWSMDLAGREVAAGPAFARLFGFPPTSSNRTWAEYAAHVHHAHRNRMSGLAGEALGKPGGAVAEVRVAPPGGPERWVRLWAVPIQNLRGETVGIAGAGADITSEAGVRNSFASVVDAATVPIVIADSSGGMHFANKAAIELLGYTLDDYREGRVRWTEITPPEYRARDEIATRSMIERGSCEPFEKVFIAKDGARIPVLLGLAALPDQQAAAFITDLRAAHSAEAALEESELRYRTMVEANPIGVLAGDIYGRVRMANQTLLDMLGFTREELERGELDWTRITPGEWLPLDAEKVAEARLAGFCTPYEKEYFRRDGARIPVLIGYALTGPNREETAVFVLDLSRQKQHERDLRHSELRLALALEAAYIIAFTWEIETDQVHRHHSSDRRVLKPTADRPETLADIAARIAPEDRELFLNNVRKPLEQPGQPYRSEHRIRGEDGNLHWLSEWGYVERDRSGKPVRLIGISSDITERVSQEQAVRESEAQFRTLANAVPLLSWMAHPSGEIFWYNDRWYQYTGATPEQMQGWGWQSVHHPDVLPRVLERWRTSLANVEPFEMVFPLRAADGSFRQFLTRAFPLRDAGGRVFRWFGTNTDIDEQKRVEDALRRSNEDLQQFAYVASHDLQEPLRTVATFTELLRRRYQGALDKDADEYIGYVVQAAHRMSHLIRDLLEYSRATTEREDDRRRVPLDEALETALYNLRGSITESRARVERDPLPVVLGSATQLAQVFQNLIGNSLKYRRPEETPAIEVRCSRRGQDWLISVRDNGIGFNARYRERIFGIFKRLHSGEYPGTGIGLAVCRTIVQRHGGDIWADSEEGQGATFSFTLPGLRDLDP